MSIYEFYISYILTGKALLVSIHFHPVKAKLNFSTISIEYTTAANSRHYEISHEMHINDLSRYGIKITLVTDPIYITASSLTGVISIPVPEPEELPF